MSSFELSEKMEALAAAHPNANKPYEPYSEGVGVLFGGDARKYGSNISPREDWIVVSPYEIIYQPRDQAETNEVDNHKSKFVRQGYERI